MKKTKKKIEKQMKVGKEILDVFKKNEIKPFEMLEILDNLKLSIDMRLIDILIKHKDK